MSRGYSMQCSCGPFFLKRPHYCINCNELLERKKRSVIVNSESEKAKNYDFYGIDTYLYGDVEFITYYFKCPNCKDEYEIRPLVMLEKEQKKQRRMKKWKGFWKNKMFSEK